jgi:hypothetical protein
MRIYGGDHKTGILLNVSPLMASHSEKKSFLLCRIAEGKILGHDQMGNGKCQQHFDWGF